MTTLEKKPSSPVAKVIWIAIGVIVAINLILIGPLWENNHADQIKVLQMPSGALSVHFDPGVFWQGFGKVTTYLKSDVLFFSAADDEGAEEDAPIQVRFRDGGVANIQGSARYILPHPSKDTGLDKAKATMYILKLHQNYRGQDNFRDRAIYRLQTEAVQQTAKFFTTEESYTTRKTEYQDLVRDQLELGVYLVDEVPDTLVLAGGEKRIATRNVIRYMMKDSSGVPQKKQVPMRKPNPLAEMAVTITNVTIYDPDFNVNNDAQGIMKQIAAKFNQKMQKYISQSKAALAQQNQITEKATGEREVEVTRFAQLTTNVTEEVNAQRDLEVNSILAHARADTAAIYKQAATWRGKAEREMGRGESRVRSLFMSADKGLEMRLLAVIEKHRVLASAVGSGQPLMPPFVIGSGKGGVGTTFDAMGIEALHNMTGGKKP